MSKYDLVSRICHVFLGLVIDLLTPEDLRGEELRLRLGPGGGPSVVAGVRGRYLHGNWFAVYLSTGARVPTVTSLCALERRRLASLERVTEHCDS